MTWSSPQAAPRYHIKTSCCDAPIPSDSMCWAAGSWPNLEYLQNQTGGEVIEFNGEPWLFFAQPTAKSLETMFSVPSWSPQPLQPWKKKDSVPTIFPTFPTFPSDSRVGSNPKRFGVTSSLVFPLDGNFPVLEADFLVLESNGLMFQGPRIFHRFQVQC